MDQKFVQTPTNYTTRDFGSEVWRVLKEKVQNNCLILKAKKRLHFRKFKLCVSGSVIHFVIPV